MWEHASVNMFTSLRNTACVKLFKPWHWLTLPRHHRLRASGGLPPPAAVHQRFVHWPAEAAEALVGLPGPWPSQRGASRGWGCHPDSPRAGVGARRCLLLVWHKAQRGLRERPRQARAWGCQGREKGRGLNERELPNCNDFIPCLLLRAIQSLPCLYPAEAARVFLQRLFE